MLAVERKNRILAILQTEKRVVVSELSKEFNVSEETIRKFGLGYSTKYRDDLYRYLRGSL